MTYDIYINSAIGWPFSADYVRDELAKCKKKPCNVYISSLGGAVIDALQIRQMFLEHGEVSVYLHGFVASAATIIAMGAKHIVMGEFALFLMHRCSNWVESWGQMNAEEIDAAIKKLEASRNALETIDQTVANIYAARCGKKVKDVAGWMHDAAWLTAEDCKARGLIDDICKDEEHPVITDALKGEILACGFPVPALREEKTADISRRSLLDGIRALFSARPASPEENHTKTSNDMNQDYKNVMAVLQADSLAAQDGKVVLSAEQMTALDTRLSSLVAEKQQQEQQIADLQAQVANLQKQDGDHTQKVEDVLTDPAEDYAARARAAYKQLKSLD